jgi:host factor-I protein
MKQNTRAGKGSAGSALQRAFLDAAVASMTELKIYLGNGVCLRGIATSWDDYTIELVYRGNAQVVYKAEIATIVPSNPLDLRERTEPA